MYLGNGSWAPDPAPSNVTVGGSQPTPVNNPAINHYANGVSNWIQGLGASSGMSDADFAQQVVEPAQKGDKVALQKLQQAVTSSGGNWNQFFDAHIQNQPGYGGGLMNQFSGYLTDYAAPLGMAALTAGSGILAGAGSAVGPASGANAGIGTGATTAGGAVGTGTAVTSAASPLMMGGGAAPGTISGTGLGGTAGMGATTASTPMVGSLGAGAGATGAGVGATGAGTSSGLGGVLNSVFGGGATAGTGLGLLGTAGQIGLDLYTANQQEKAGNHAADLADPFASQRPQYQQDLANLMNNPNSITNDPSYKFRFDQGQQALERSNVAKGYLGSGNMGYDLINYGQGAASDELNKQKAFLAQLAGANTGNPGAAASAYGTGQGNSIAQTYQGLSGLGTLAGNILGTNRPSTAYNSGANSGALV